MCGRFVRASPEDVVRRAFGVTSAAAVDFRPRYNIAPGEPVATIVADREAEHGHEREDRPREERSGRRLGMMRWGFEPAPGSSTATVINARSETASRRFRESFFKRRCLVVADGFYEWRRAGGIKIPHFFALASRRPFGLAALWNRAGPSRIPACAILTCSANELVAGVHERMPVILDERSAEHWLDPAAGDRDLQSLLEPYPAAEMLGHPVSALVNSARNDSPDCIVPAEPFVGGTLRLVDKAD